MALDYSKLTDDELDAIANDDYSKLSDKTLRQMSSDPTAQTSPDINMTPQALGVARELAPAAGQTVATAGKIAAGIPKDWYDIGKILYNNASLNTVGEAIKEPWKTATGAVGAYVEGHPTLGKITAATPKQAVGALASGARNIGGALVTGAVAPESMIMAPYQMAAYEQEKIRANPDAPEYATNPYAQSYRGEYPTQGAAGAANARQAVANAPTGYTPTAQEAGNLLASNDERTINIYGGRKRLEEIVSSGIRGQAAQRIKPVVPGQL
jgi:hypothetical protein